MIMNNYVRFYSYPLSKKEFKQKKKYFLPGYELILSSTNRPIGKNVICKFCQQLAEKAGIDNPTRSKNQSWRHFGNDRNDKSMPLADTMSLARHRSANTHRAYMHSSSGSEVAHLEATYDNKS